jgi:chromosome segregation ATPase
MMLRNRIRSAIHGLAISLVTVLILAIPLATPSAHASAVPGVLPETSPDSLLVLLPPRAVDTAQQDLAAVEARGDAANADLVSAQGRLAVAKAQVEVRKSEIETIKTKVKLAKEQKNQTEQADLELQIKGKTLQLKMLEARRDMRDAEAGLADARRQAAQTGAAFFKKELELLARRADLLRTNSARDGAANLDGLVRLQSEIRDLERRCIEILKDVADKEKSVSEREITLLDKRLEVHAAQLALLAGSKN